MRLEWAPPEHPKMHIDIVVFAKGKIIPIELKYKTKKIDTVVNGERYVLKTQGAQDHGMYDLLNDVSRLELLQSRISNITEGYVIMLTNDPSYRVAPRIYSKHTAFSLIDGESRTGQLSWLVDSRSTKTRPGINLTHEYPIKWEHYSKIENNVDMHQLVIRVGE